MPNLSLTRPLACLLILLPAAAALGQDMVASHRFSADELVALPAGNCITNGGNTWNQRYSSLTQINRYNVAYLKALDVTTNKLKWRREWREICFNGSVATAFAGSDRGDTIWPFSLNGAIDQVSQTEAAPRGGPPAVSPDLALQADLDNGSTIYDNACAACHGETGQGGQDGGPALTNALSLSEVMLVVNDGRNTMPAFNVFTDQQLLDISTFVAERLHQ